MVILKLAETFVIFCIQKSSFAKQRARHIWKCAMNTDRVVTNVYTLFSLGFELHVAMSNSLISTEAEVTTLHEERSTLRTRYSSVILSCVPHRGYIPFWYDLQGVGVV